MLPTCTQLKHVHALHKLRVSRQVAAERDGGRPDVQSDQVWSGGRGTFSAANGVGGGLRGFSA